MLIIGSLDTPAPTTTSVRRDAFEEVGGFDERFSILEDTECWMRICGDPRKERALKGYVLVPQISGFHTIGINNTTNRGSQSPAFEDDIETIFSENSIYFNQFIRFRKPKIDPQKFQFPNGRN